MREVSVSRRVMGKTPVVTDVVPALGIGRAVSVALMVDTAASLMVMTPLSSRCRRSKAPKKNVRFRWSGPPKVPP